MLHHDQQQRNPKSFVEPHDSQHKNAENLLNPVPLDALYPQQQLSHHSVLVQNAHGHSHYVQSQKPPLRHH